MLSKVDRFLLWRGEKAEQEQKYFNTAKLFASYVDSAPNLQVILDDFAMGVKSQRFEALNEFKARSLGALLYLKLVVEEFLEQIPQDEEHSPARDILVNINLLLSNLYDRPKETLKKDVLHFFECMQNILDLNNFADPMQERRLLFAFYVCFRLILITIETLLWPILKAANLVFPVDDFKNKMNLLLNKIELKVKKIEFDLEHPEFNALNALQNALSQRYVCLLAGTHSSQLTPLRAELDKVSEQLTELIKLRRHQAMLSSDIHLISGLLEAKQENDQLVTGRLYFLDLIQKNKTAYQLLVKNTQKTSEGIHFLKAVAQLKQAVDESHLSLRMTNYTSQLSRPLTEVYRKQTPQIVQNLVNTLMPATYDSACKHLLSELAASHLADLKNQLLNNKQQMVATYTQLFSDSEELKLLMDDEPVERFEDLLVITHAMKDLIKNYNELYASIRENWAFFCRYQHNAEDLERFIDLHNTYFVSVLTVLARYFSFFNTDTVQIINKARACKENFELLGEQYKDAVGREISLIDNDVLFNQDMKNQLKKGIRDELVATMGSRGSSEEVMSKRSVRLLIKSSQTLFASKPSPRASMPESRILLF